MSSIAYRNQPRWMLTWHEDFLRGNQTREVWGTNSANPNMAVSQSYNVISLRMTGELTTAPDTNEDVTVSATLYKDSVAGGNIIAQAVFSQRGGAGVDWREDAGTISNIPVSTSEDMQLVVSQSYSGAVLARCDHVSVMVECEEAT